MSICVNLCPISLSCPRHWLHLLILWFPERVELDIVPRLSGYFPNAQCATLSLSPAHMDHQIDGLGKEFLGSIKAYLGIDKHDDTLVERRLPAVPQHER